MSIQPIEDHEAVAPSPLLFEPITFRRVTLRNRIVVSPMAMYSAHDGFADIFISFIWDVSRSAALV